MSGSDAAADSGRVCLVAVCSEGHRPLLDEWFLPTLQDDYGVVIHDCRASHGGAYMEDAWTEVVKFKSEKIIEAIRRNWGRVFVYSDVDVQFFAPTWPAIEVAIADKDIVCQLDSPGGELCTGLFAARGNELTLRLWEGVRGALAVEGRDQMAFNRILRQIPGLRFGRLPPQFFSKGTFSTGMWRGGRIFIPRSPIAHHANFTFTVEQKLALLRKVRRAVRRGPLFVAANNLACGIGGGIFHDRGASRGGPEGGAARRRRTDPFSRPALVDLDVSTVCQLRCPSCPTARGVIADQLGAGFMTASRFEEFLRRHPWVSCIELSNWGEIFLNPEIERIFRCAYRRNVALRADNGVNLSRVRESALEALVRYRVRGITCSIDGATQETYGQYRVGGNLDQVLANIRRINAHKKAFRTRYPRLRWQFIAFGHNEHEIAAARSMAADLGMTFYVKLAWDDLYGKSFSPVKDRGLVSRESGLRVADRREFVEKTRQDYVGLACHQLWLMPHINQDGRVLGCSINHWGDYGNAFESGLEACLRGDRMTRAREALQGLREADPDVPCAHCKIYHSRRRRNDWVRPEEFGGFRVEGRLKNLIKNRLEGPGLLRVVRWIRGAGPTPP